MRHDPRRLIGQQLRRVDHPDLQGGLGSGLLTKHPTDGHPLHSFHVTPPWLLDTRIGEGLLAPQCRVSSSNRDDSHRFGKESLNEK